MATTRTQDPGMDEIRAMAWDAQVIAPTSSEDVTVVMRVTYHTIEAICGDLFDETASTPTAARLS